VPLSSGDRRLSAVSYQQSAGNRIAALRSR